MPSTCATLSIESLGWRVCIGASPISRRKRRMQRPPVRSRLNLHLRNLLFYAGNSPPPQEARRTRVLPRELRKRRRQMQTREVEAACARDAHNEPGCLEPRHHFAALCARLLSELRVVLCVTVCCSEKNRPRACEKTGARSSATAKTHRVPFCWS